MTTSEIAIDFAIDAAAAQAGYTVYDAVTARALVDGDAVAVLDAESPDGEGVGGAISYRDLVAASEALAARLIGAGVGPGDLVAVSLTRSSESVIALLGVLAAGAAYVPLDPAAPPARTQATLRRHAIRWAVADAAGADCLGDGPTVVGPNQTVRERVARPRPDADSLAYVMQTSGSTGVPKAVAMPHRGLQRLLDWQVADGPAALRTVQFTATTFDVSFQEVLSTLVTGGCLVLASERIRRDPDALVDVIRRHRVQRLFLPYIALQSLAVAAVRRHANLSCLEHVITAGERLVVTPAIRELFGALPHCRLDNHYGPTETHLATALTLAGPAEGWPELPSIGDTVGGVAYRVLDDHLREVADTEVGELYLAGAGLARGYLDDPSRTAERFVASPFGTGERLYRTGDLVRAVPGRVGLDFIGRADRQVKVRGYRVEPAEVELALVTHPLVDAAAVDVRELDGAGPVLVGYLETTADVSFRDLAEHLRDRLPGWLIPTRFVALESLPRSSSGKVDARALAAVELPTVAESPVSDTSGTSAADRIVAIWRRVLGHDEFDTDDDFFDIGGDSLLATWVLAELAEELGSSIGLSEFLGDSTVDGLVAALAVEEASNGRRPRFSQLTTLRPGPSARTAYLIHPLGGEVIGYRELARAARAPFRLVGVGCGGVVPQADASLPDIARAHVERLRTVQRDGPFLLIGWSFGGVLAYEIAQQLRAAGQAVDLLGLIDANPLVDPLTGLAMAQTPFLSMLDELLARLDEPSCSPGEIRELTSAPVWVQLMGAPIELGVSGDYLRAVLRTARACMSAAMRYEPRPYGGPVTLFQAGGAGRERQDRLVAALQTLCDGRFTTVELAGDHWGLMRTPDVTETAYQLAAALGRAGAEGDAIDGS